MRPLTITTVEHDRIVAELAHSYEKKLDALRVEIAALRSSKPAQEAASAQESAQQSSQKQPQRQGHK